jgi:large subunit ribosomal protein L16
MLFIPIKTKFKKQQKGKKLNKISKINCLENFNFGKLTLRSMDTGHINSKQINAFKQTINKIIKKKGKLKINIFPNTPISKKPLEVRMGKGKGNVDR